MYWTPLITNSLERISLVLPILLSAQAPLIAQPRRMSSALEFLGDFGISLLLCLIIFKLNQLRTIRDCPAAINLNTLSSSVPTPMALPSGLDNGQTLFKSHASESNQCNCSESLTDITQA